MGQRLANKLFFRSAALALLSGLMVTGCSGKLGGRSRVQTNNHRSTAPDLKLTQQPLSADQGAQVGEQFQTPAEPENQSHLPPGGIAGQAQEAEQAEGSKPDTQGQAAAEKPDRTAAPKAEAPIFRPAPQDSTHTLRPGVAVTGGMQTSTEYGSNAYVDLINDGLIDGLRTKASGEKKDARMTEHSLVMAENIRDISVNVNLEQKWAQVRASVFNESDRVEIDLRGAMDKDNRKSTLVGKTTANGRTYYFRARLECMDISALKKFNTADVKTCFVTAVKLEQINKIAVGSQVQKIDEMKDAESICKRIYFVHRWVDAIIGIASFDVARFRLAQQKDSLSELNPNFANLMEYLNNSLLYWEEKSKGGQNTFVWYDLNSPRVAGMRSWAVVNGPAQLDIQLKAFGAHPDQITFRAPLFGGIGKSLTVQTRYGQAPFGGYSHVSEPAPLGSRFAQGFEQVNLVNIDDDGTSRLYVTYRGTPQTYQYLEFEPLFPEVRGPGREAIQRAKK